MINMVLPHRYQGGAYRRRLFSKPPPAGWMPAIGEWVYLAAIRGTLGKNKSIAQVTQIAGKFIRVTAVYGRRPEFGIFEIDEIRPIPKPRKKAVSA